MLQQKKYTTNEASNLIPILIKHNSTIHKIENNLGQINETT